VSSCTQWARLRPLIPATFARLRSADPSHLLLCLDSQCRAVAENIPTSFKVRENFRVQARKLWVFIRKPLWFIQETLPRHDEVLHRFAGFVQHYEHVDVFPSYFTYRKVALHSQGFHLNGEVPPCVGIVGKQINLFRVAEGDRGLYAPFQAFRSYEQFTSKAGHALVYGNFLGNSAASVEFMRKECSVLCRVAQRLIPATFARPPYLYGAPLPAAWCGDVAIIQTGGYLS
jgi:hypothetical protein